MDTTAATASPTATSHTIALLCAPGARLTNPQPRTDVPDSLFEGFAPPAVPIPPLQRFNRPPSDGHLRTTKEDFMGFGVSLFLIAVGAILTWAVTAEVSGLDINRLSASSC